MSEEAHCCLIRDPKKGHNPTVGAIKFFSQSFWVLPPHHDVRLCGICSSPDFNH
jgi:hypothetical protein